MLGSRTRFVQGRFAEADFDFVVSILNARESRQHLHDLWSDLDGRRELMDLPEVFRGLLESPMTLAVSPDFYFYVMVRHALLRAALSEYRLAEYVSGLMSRRVNHAQCSWLEESCGIFTHAAPYLTLIDTARGCMKTRLKLTAGEQFLILTGLYPSMIKRTAADTDTCDFGFYEGFVKRAYLDAARARSPFSAETRRTCSCVASCVPELRRALNGLVEDWLFLGE